MSDIHEINEIEQLEDYRTAWKGLLAQTRHASFFQTLDWLQCYWRHYASPANQPPQRLRVIVVRQQGQPLGIVPLTVIQERTRVGPIRVLTYPLHDWGCFYGPIGPDPALALRAALQHIAATQRDWDLLDLRWVDEDRAEHGYTARAMQAAGLAARRGVWNQTALVENRAGWDAYFASKTSKWRNNMRRFQRRLAELGDVELVRHRPRGADHGDADPRWDLYDAAVEVARRSWQAAATDGTTICHDSVAAFFRETYALAVNNGMMDLCLLWAGGQPIAFGYNYYHQGCASGIRFGFDQQHARSGAGNAMYLHMLRDGFARGDRLFNMGVGSLEIKQPWLTSTASAYRFTHYPLASPRSQLLRLKHWWDRRKAIPARESKPAAAAESDAAASIQA